jgi:periplasmic divalent cation tolerance protein
MLAGPVVVWITCPDADVAAALAQRLVEARLAACVNRLSSPVHSTYWWEGAIQQDTEQLLMVKTLAQHLPALQQCVLAHHPYTVPEIIAVPVPWGHPPYLAWIQEATQGAADGPQPEETKVQGA